MKLVNLKITNVRECEVLFAVERARHFAMQWPDRVGRHNDVLYRLNDGSFMRVHRTPGGQIVVRGYHE